MIVYNRSGQWIHLSRGYSLPPSESAEIPSEIYLGNESLKNQIDNLYEDEKIFVGPPDIPQNFLPDEESPRTQIYGYDLTFAKNQAYATLSIEQEFDSNDYGKLELGSTNESNLHLSSYAKDEDDSMFEISKSSGEAGKIAQIFVDGSSILQIGSTGTIGFFGADGTGQQVLDPDTADTADIVNALIALGLISES